MYMSLCCFVVAFVMCLFNFATCGNALVLALSGHMAIVIDANDDVLPVVGVVFSNVTRVVVEIVVIVDADDDDDFSRFSLCFSAIFC